MNHENLIKWINRSIDDLLQLSGQYCWNRISLNLVFILSDSNEFDGADLFKRRESRKMINNSKTPITLDAAIEVLNNEYHDLYDINLYIFKADKKETLIEIQYYRKSNFEIDYFAKIKDNPPMFHSKISIPSYALGVGKFDVNWESGGGINHVCKNLLYQLMRK
ncbi:hypothetical protein [Chryseobacterium sp.]|nr:hypothetical protein [Chryseobacterium sp.]HCM35735.1 hypothetical protein [Chryseobacterium sp.]